MNATASYIRLQYIADPDSGLCRGVDCDAELMKADYLKMGSAVFYEMWIKPAFDQLFAAE